jgi:hypothetical protein
MPAHIFGTDPGNYETTVKVNTTSVFNKTNLSLPVEVGYSLSLGNKKTTTRINVNVFARYEYDFLEILRIRQLVHQGSHYSRSV